MTNFSVDKIKAMFPFPEFRENQESVLTSIVNSFNNGIDVFMLNAPVGSGKSPEGIDLGRMTGEYVNDDDVFGCYYSTPYKMLQDQLEKDFREYIEVIKGRGSYPCSVLVGNTCADGKCQIDTNFECDKWCPYIAARDAAMKAQIACSNFSYLMVVPPFIFKKRELLIVDEAHSVGDRALDYVSCTINAGVVYAKGGIPSYKTFDEYAKWLHSVASELMTRLEDANKQMKEADEAGDLILGLKERRDGLALVLSKVMNLINDYHDNNEDWTWQILDKGTRKERIQFKPITAGRFLDKVIWWRGEKLLLMSGTLFPELFVEEAGLTDKVCEFRNVQSTFPVKNRPIYYWPAGKMTMDQREYTIPTLAERVHIIMDRNKGKKGFMHCGSYQIASDVYDILMDINPDGDVWLQDKSRRDAHLEEWMESKEPSFFMSINRTEGVDLKAELCGYQIVGKVQFPYLGDAQVKARMNMKKYRCPECGKVIRTVEELVNCTCGGRLVYDMDVYVFTCGSCGRKLISGWDRHQEILSNDKCVCGGKMSMSVVTIDGQYWYNSCAVIDLVQSYGRANRSPTDKSEFWINDSSFMPLYKRMYLLFPKMFKEAVKVIK